MNQPMLTREDGEQLTSYEGKFVVRVSSENGNYREWMIHEAHRTCCIVNEGEDWALLYRDHSGWRWKESLLPVDEFLTTHNLILAA